MSGLIVLIGIPGVGKTTWAERVKDAHEAVVVSRDLGLPRFRTAIRGKLSNGHVVIGDGTNLTEAVRADLLNEARHVDAKCVAVLFTDLAGAWERNARRALPVPTVAMGKYTALFHRTVTTLPDEGFDYVIHNPGVEPEEA